MFLQLYTDSVKTTNVWEVRGDRNPPERGPLNDSHRSVHKISGAGTQVLFLLGASEPRGVRRSRIYVVSDYWVGFWSLDDAVTIRVQRLGLVTLVLSSTTRWLGSSKTKNSHSQRKFSTSLPIGLKSKELACKLRLKSKNREKMLDHSATLTQLEAALRQSISLMDIRWPPNCPLNHFTGRCGSEIWAL